MALLSTASDGRGVVMFHDCEECNGHGILMAREGWVRCDVCDGSGRNGVE